MRNSHAELLVLDLGRADAGDFGLRVMAIYLGPHLGIGSLRNTLKLI